MLDAVALALEERFKRVGAMVFARNSSREKRRWKSRRARAWFHERGLLANVGSCIRLDKRVPGAWLMVTSTITCKFDFCWPRSNSL